MQLVPLVNWAGGKRQIIDIIKNSLPRAYNKYYEPFVGGGSVFMNILPANGVINDINPMLVNMYKQVKASPEALIEECKTIEEEVLNTKRETVYFKIRDAYNKKISKGIYDVQSAAYMIFITKHAFNGLYRVNSKGLMNVSYNSTRDGVRYWYDSKNIRNISFYLNQNNIEIMNTDFETVCSRVRKGDFVYFDSPYIPERGKTGCFGAYSKDNWSWEDHKRLVILTKDLTDRGAYVMLSNNECSLIYELYEQFHIKSFPVRRSINCNGDGRKGIEVLITNYEIDEPMETLFV